MLKLAHRWRSAAQARAAISATLKARYPLRWHSFLLFAWTIFAGTLVARVCYSLGLIALPGRYALACTIGYAAFLFGVRVWLWHVEAIPEDHGSVVEPTDFGNVIDLGLDGADILGSAVDGETAEAALAAGENGVAALALVAIALAVTVAILLLGPELLIDVAFEAILAGSLIGVARLGHEPDWFLRVLGKTWWIFLLVAGLMVGFGKYAQRHYPEAKTSAQVVQKILGSRK